MKWFKKKETEKREAPEKDIPRNRDEFSTNLPQLQAAQVQAKLAELYKAPDLKPVNAEGAAVDSKDYALDSCTGFSFSNMRMEAIAPIQLDWFGSQTFIGHQACGIIAQHWLVQKACDMPARDAIRNGYELTFNGGEGEINPEIKEKIRKLDKKYKINKTMREYVKFGRVYGIRVALFSVDIKDIKKKKEYYAKPFNIDGVKPGTYNGIVQIDPEWITPELDLRALNDPTSAHFYEPTFWRTANGLRIHRSHLSIFVNGEVTDMLKPMYQYGGVSVSQKIFERVYAAEKTANEAPQLALTKRTTVLRVDMDAATANPQPFIAKLKDWVFFRDNFAVKAIGLDEDVDQKDTSLADLDAVIMTQYQIVAAIANVPATKLLGTAPKGFNSTGEYEEESYRQELESIQENDLDPLLNRHYQMMMKSDINPDFDFESIELEIKWEALDAPTAKEQADTNFVKSQTAINYQMTGSVDGEDIRAELIASPDSDFTMLEEIAGEEEEDILDIINSIRQEGVGGSNDFNA